MADIARILLYGDIHLSSKNYGSHVDYPKESLAYFRKITEKAEESKATHIIGTGDLTYGRFHTLEYREAVEAEMVKQYELVNGNRFEVKGNHDSATYGMTEYEYYIKKGLIKPSTNLKLGNVNISMVDYGHHYKTKILDCTKEDEINVVVAHDFFKFKDTPLPNYGKAIELDYFIDWFGVDYLICGHVHKHEMFDGLVLNNGNGHAMVVNYIGCMSRPSYREGHTDEIGHMILLTIRDNGEMQYDILDIPLWDLADSFNIAKKVAEKNKKIDKEQRVDISDIVEQLNSHERAVGNTEDIIASIQGVDERYKKKAIELLKEGQA